MREPTPDRRCRECGEPLTTSEVERGWKICNDCRAKARRKSRSR